MHDCTIIRDVEYSYREYQTTQHFSFLPTFNSVISKRDISAKAANYLSGYTLLVTTYREYINTGLKVKFRSYDYNENYMYSWNNISKYDITFDPILKAKQCFLELNYNPIHYGVSSYFEELKIFDFTNLSHQYGGYFEMFLSIGLGNQYNLSVDYFTTLP